MLRIHGVSLAGPLVMRAFEDVSRYHTGEIALERRATVRANCSRRTPGRDQPGLQRLYHLLSYTDRNVQLVTRHYRYGYDHSRACLSARETGPAGGGRSDFN